MSLYTYQVYLSKATYLIIFYLFLRKLAIKRVPNFDLWFRLIEFFIVAQIMAPIGKREKLRKHFLRVKGNFS